MGRRILAIVAALVVALLGVFGVVAYAQAADNRAIAGQQTQTVFIATSTVPIGTTAADALSQQLMVTEKVVAKGVPKGALQAVTADNAKLVATSEIVPGEIIVASRFGVLPSMTKTQLIPTGMIAITVSLTDAQRVAPLLTPQSHIVIFDTLGGAAKNASSTSVTSADAGTTPPITRILLADVQVIGVGDQTAQPTPSPTATAGAQQTASNAALVTVAVSPADAQLLVQAVQAGNLLYAGLLGSDVKVDPTSVVSDATMVAARS